jgi:CRISP-associated protein Cas1
VIDKLIGLAGIAATIYFGAFDRCVQNPDFTFIARSHRPLDNPVNAILRCDDRVIWNRLMSIVNHPQLFH